MKLETGFYKIKSKRRLVATYHYLRVFVKQGKRYYQIDHGLPDEMDKNESYSLNGYEVVKRILRPIEVKNVKLSVEFEDEDGDTFILSGRNLNSVDRIFINFPRVGKALGINRFEKDEPKKNGGQ